MSNKQTKTMNFSRREFLGTMAATAAFTIVPRSVLGGPGYTAPSDMVNLAGVGIGAQGGGDIRNIMTPEVPIQSRQGAGYTRFSYPYSGIQAQSQQARGAAGEAAQGSRTPAAADSDAPVQLGAAAASGQSFKHANIYALCDTDHEYAAHILAGYPSAKQYHDYREMLDKEKEIDAVLIGTCDHTHAIIASAAMKAGKHVFVEKPMCKTIYEARYLSNLAKENPRLVTQVGNQGHNGDGSAKVVEWIQSGAIGNVTEVHVWSNRPSWKQGWHERPEGVPVPSNLKYDLWLGPAPEKPYHPDLVHFNWRGLWDYGNGALGDMGAHTLDAPIRALNLGMPTKIQATSTPFTDAYLPQTVFCTYEFPARGNMPPVKLTWNDGGIKPPRPAALEANRGLRECLYIGDKGMIMHGAGNSTAGAAPELVPMNPDFKEPPQTLPRPSTVYVDFIEAIKEGRQAYNSFDMGARMCEIMLLSNIAVLAQRINITLEYDAANMRITNLPEANDYFHYEYRKGWSL